VSIGPAPDPPGRPDAAGTLLELYDRALPQVYGYLLPRCGQVALAEDITGETFLAAVDAVRKPEPPPVSIGWLIGIARHKLVDHWRRQGREDSRLRAVADDPAHPASVAAEDPWDEELDALAARDMLAQLAPQHQAALTLRYVDDLTVPQVAALLDRTVHATEALLTRSRSAFRRVYLDHDSSDQPARPAPALGAHHHPGEEAPRG
jgi:RNA polymerase sigma-70 factor (ECF subfamily)